MLAFWDTDKESLIREILNFMSLQLHIQMFIHTEIHLHIVLEEKSFFPLECRSAMIFFSLLKPLVLYSKPNVATTACLKMLFISPRSIISSTKKWGRETLKLSL